MSDAPPRGDRSAAVTPAIETVLAQAAGDEELRALLLSDRMAAVAASGVALSPLERSMLAAVPEAQLRALIEALPPIPRRVSRQPEMLVTGINPDIPPPRPGPPHPPGPPAGVRPDRPIALATAIALGAAAAGGAAYYFATRDDAKKDGKTKVEEPTKAKAGGGSKGPRK